MKNPTLPFSAHKVLVLAAFCGSAGLLSAQTNIAVNNSGAASDPSAIMDVSSTYTLPTRQKGLLIPRMTLAQRNLINGGAPADGLLIYQTNSTPGFYYNNSGTWLRISDGKTGWSILGNDVLNPAVDFFGSTDATPVRFATNNVERMRILPTGEVAIGQLTATQRVEVAGAVRIYGTTATNNVGTIRWNDPDSIHEGYMGGTLGWRQLENEYNVVTGQPYTQQNQSTCSAAPSNAIIPDNTGLSTFSAAPLVTPFPNHTSVRSARHQYLMTRTEMDVELNQLAGNTAIQAGLCPGGNITAIGFYKQGGLGALKGWNWEVSIFHVPFGVNDLSGGYEANIDPGFACGQGAGNFPASLAVGWHTIPLSSPFQWDGVRSVVVQVCMNYSAGATGSPTGYVPVAVTTIAGGAPANQRTYSQNALPTTGNCGLAGPNCAGTPTGACGMAMTPGCSTLAAGSSNVRPVMRFTGIISTTPGPALTGNGDYIQYNGGFLVENTPNWRFTTLPSYSFKGPGRINAENGVYDNGVQLSDHVFDRHYDGRVHVSDAENHGAQRNLAIDEMSEFTALNRHLPTMKGRKDWNGSGEFSFGDLTNQLWTTTETQALYLIELHEKAKLLEALSTDRPIDAKEFGPMRQAAATMEELNEREKKALIEDLGNRTTGSAQ